METIKINGEDYVKKTSIPYTKIEHEVKIVVLNRGFMAVGRVAEEGNKTVIRECSIIRTWGTTGKGIGEIAENGPTKDTILDKCTTITVETCNVVFTIDCNQNNW